MNKLNLKIEDIFKPATPDDLSNRQAEQERMREEEKKQKNIRMETAKCPKCGDLIKDGITDLWSGYVNTTQNHIWDPVNGEWVDNGKMDSDYGDGDTEIQCVGCGNFIDLEELGVPGIWY